MQDVRGFRRYYNEKLHSELLGFEKKRKRLLLLMLVSCLILGAISGIIISLGVFALSIFLVIPWALLMQFLYKKTQEFKDQFKPLVVSSILYFIDPKLKYFHDEYISRDSFMRSGIFPVDPEIYTGEDYIMGKIGEVFFEMCELEVHDISDINDKMRKVFEGIFFHAHFNTNFKGRIVLIPRPEWQFFIRTMKDFTKYGGYELVDTGNPSFDEEFLVYIDKGVHYKDILTQRLIDTINGYHLESTKRVYASFIDSHFYMAIAEPYDLLEASVFFPNLDFDTIAKFYEELFLFTKIVEDFDFMH